MSLAVVVVDIAPLYVKPEDRSELADEALYGMVVDILERSGDFCRIRTHYRYEGWTPARCLLEDPALIVKWQAADHLIVQKPYIDVLDRPKVQGGLLQSMPRGAVVCPAGKPDADLWQPVYLADGRLGYTKTTYLSAPAPDWTKENEAVLRRKLCETALLYLGAQYRWGGKTPLGIDCSGLVSMAYLLNGIVIYRDAAIKDGFALREISFQDAGPGDLLFFPGHVAMYLGEGKFVHSTGHTGTEGVVLSSLIEGAEDCRPDLKKSMTAVGSVFSAGKNAGTPDGKM